MATFNKIIVIGNLTRDPDYKTLASGQSVCRLSIATNRQFRNKQTGTMTQEVCYIDVDVWGPQAEHCKQYLQKGRAVLVDGRLKYDTWQDQTGSTRSKHSIVADRVVFLGQGVQTEAVSSEYESDFNLDNITKQTSADNSSSSDVFMNKTKGLSSNFKNVKKGAQVTTAIDNDIEINMGGEIDLKDEPPFQDDLPF